MTTVVIELLDRELIGEVYFSNLSCQEFAKKYADAYTAVATIETDKVGKDAAEEMFDLTNNPFRDEERAALYGRGRSVSVGDIVKVGDVSYFCDSCGWAVL